GVGGLDRRVWWSARSRKIYGEEEGRVRVDALELDAGGVRAAGGDVVRPEGEARGVRLAVEEVEVVLADEEVRVVNGVRGRGRRVVVEYGHIRRARAAQP